MTERKPTRPQQDENQIIAERRAKLAALREHGIAFPNDFRRKHLPPTLHAAHARANPTKSSSRAAAQRRWPAA